MTTSVGFEVALGTLSFKMSEYRSPRGMYFVLQLLGQDPVAPVTKASYSMGRQMSRVLLRLQKTLGRSSGAGCLHPFGEIPTGPQCPRARLPQDGENLDTQGKASRCTESKGRCLPESRGPFQKTISGTAMANEDRQTILWQTNHLEMPPAFCSYHLVTNDHLRRETGTGHKHLGP